MANTASARAIWDAYNARDFTALRGHYADEVICHRPDLPAPLRGADNLIALFEALVASFPDIHATVVTTVEADRHVVVEFVEEGTFTGAPLQVGEHLVPPNGAAMRVPIVEILEFDADGRCRASRGYRNMLDGLRQLGLLP